MNATLALYDFVAIATQVDESLVMLAHDLDVPLADVVYMPERGNTPRSNHPSTVVRGLRLCAVGCLWSRHSGSDGAVNGAGHVAGHPPFAEEPLRVHAFVEGEVLPPEGGGSKQQPHGETRLLCVRRAVAPLRTARPRWLNALTDSVSEP